MLRLGQRGPDTIRKVERLLAQHAAAQTAPLVVWSLPGEAPERFAARVSRVRVNFAGRVLAVIPAAYAVPSTVEPVELPPKLFELLHPAYPSRYRCSSGGRGSGKSNSHATVLVLTALSRRVRILCAREIMRSLRESVHHLSCDKIEALKLGHYFDITDREISCRTTGSQIIFAGLWANINTLKSLENISLVWIEEAESVSARSLEVLTPTVRAVDSEIWLSCNPDSADAPVMQFIEGKRPDTRHVHVTFEDNPWFPESLEGERLYLQRVDDDAYRHVWLGECRTISDAQIFKGKYTVEEFTPGAEWSGPFHGLDLGFSSDPSVLTKCWVFDNRLYVEREAWGLHIDIDKLPVLLDQIPGARDHTIRVDSSRPETISYLKQHGFPDVVSVDKWPDSVTDGISRMRAFEQIVIHPSCTHTADEFRLYSYKVDRLTSDVLADVVDKHNHCVDSIRYGIAPLIKRQAGAGLLEFYGKELAQAAAEKAIAASTPQHETLWHRAERAGAKVSSL